MLKIIFSLNTLWWLILLLYIPACFGLIIIVLLQKGKGQGLAGMLGMSGSVDTIFGPRSSKSLPQKITYASAAIFMTLALVMSILSGKVGRSAAPQLIPETPQASLESLFENTGTENAENASAALGAQETVSVDTSEAGEDTESSVDTSQDTSVASEEAVSSEEAVQESTNEAGPQGETGSINVLSNEPDSGDSSGTTESQGQ